MKLFSRRCHLIPSDLIIASRQARLSASGSLCDEQSLLIARAAVKGLGHAQHEALPLVIYQMCQVSADPESSRPTHITRVPPSRQKAPRPTRIGRLRKCDESRLEPLRIGEKTL